MDNFDEIIKDELVIVDFYAEWCGPCRMLSPILDELKEEYKIIRLDVDKNESLAKKYGIMSIPTLIKFKNGEEVDKHIGFIPKDELIDWINK